MTTKLKPTTISRITAVLPWVNLAIAITALLISYSVSLSHPDIRVSASAPQWVMRPMQLGDTPTKNNAAIKLTCAFSNLGARNGVVDDILLRLESQDDATRWLFYPAVQLDDTKFLSSDIPTPPNAIKGLIATFYPVAVPGRQSQVVTYLFIPMLKHPDFPFQDFSPHKFKVEVLTRSNGTREWVTQETFTVTLDQQSLDKIHAGITLQQFPDEMDQLRRDVTP